MNAFLTRLVRLSSRLALILVMLGVSLGTPSKARADGNFLVNSSADTVLQDNYLTLREAILVANGAHTGAFSYEEKNLIGGGCTWMESPPLSDNWYITGGACGVGYPDTITFHPSINQITLTSCFQDLADAGTTIDGGSPDPLIINAIGCTGHTFVIDDNDITIQYLSIINTSPGYNDIQVKTGSRAEIVNNQLGMRLTSTYCDSTRNGDNGIGVVNTTTGTSGDGLGSAYIFNNVIGCHGQHGIFIDGADYVYVGVDPSSTIHSNYIGIYSIYSVPNGYDGVSIMDYYSDPARDNLISNNWIANNGRHGVNVYNSTNNTIRGNIIGLGVSGAAAPNAEDGVRISGLAAAYNTIGGSTAAHRNIISGNAQSGVHILDGAGGNQIQSNYIGANLDNTGLIPNGLAGVAIEGGAHGNVIGSSSNGSEMQFIVGNTREGVFMGDYTYNNLIGRMTTIYGNGLGGVVVVGNGAHSNSINPATCYGNGGPPIDLGGDGHTPNDPGDGDTGPNGLLNYPEVTSVSGQVINGLTCGNCQVVIYYANGNPSTPFGGGSNLGFVGASGSGNWSIDLSTLGYYLTAADITLVAYGFQGSSEMSPRPVVYLPLVIK